MNKFVKSGILEISMLYKLNSGKVLSKKFKSTFFIFRRDLRLEDNTGLLFALEHSEIVIPAFILTPEQINNNPYRSDHCLKFMIESLQDLSKQLHAKKSKLFLFTGKAEEVLTESIIKLNIEAVIVNKDYTPYSQMRDKKLEHVCTTHRIPFYSFNDALLHPPEMTLKKDGNPYTIFTPYFRNASKLKVIAPRPNRKTNYFQGSIPFAEKEQLLSKILPKTKTSLKGGRNEALKILKKLGSLDHYKQLRDCPKEDCCTHLSAYLKFTVCSPREVYAAVIRHLGPDHELIRSLYWRDFFTGIAFFFPQVFKEPFHAKYKKLKWSNDKTAFQKWKDGLTGFPIVDAGMRELNATGFMHNRIRMIVASFLVKDLHIDWRWGEKYFAQTLVDYDPAVNNGNWQWAASTGCDAQPYFRIFNPWRQQEKFDADCTYIKKWIPELRPLSAAIIHKWHEKKYHSRHPEYPPPLIDHNKEAKLALNAYKN